MHMKMGSLLSFVPYLNLRMLTDQYVVQADWATSAAECADECLALGGSSADDSDKDNWPCTGFLYIIREKGMPPASTSCKLVKMPPNFLAPAGLVSVDGTLEVSDFYQRELPIDATQPKAGPAVVGDMSGSMPRLPVGPWLSVSLLLASFWMLQC